MIKEIASILKQATRLSGALPSDSQENSSGAKPSRTFKETWKNADWAAKRLMDTVNVIIPFNQEITAFVGLSLREKLAYEIILNSRGSLNQKLADLAHLKIKEAKIFDNHADKIFGEYSEPKNDARRFSESAAQIILLRFSSNPKPDDLGKIGLKLDLLPVYYGLQTIIGRASSS